MRPVIDGDVVAYQASVLGSDSGSLDWGSIVTHVGNEALALSIARHKIDKWTRTAGASGSPIIALSDPDGANFRKDFAPHYKENRKGMEKPEDYETVIEYFKEKYLCYSKPGLEGDDIISLLLTGENGNKYVGISTDKDLYTIPGNICHIVHHSKADEQGVRIKQTLLDADRAWMTQTIAGDTVDNYKGAPGAGVKRANVVLEQSYSLNMMWEQVLMVYAAQFDDKRWGEKFVCDNAYDEALMNARCARLLRYGDYDNETGEVNLWTP